MKKEDEQTITFGSNVGTGIGCLFQAIALVIIILAVSGQLVSVIKIIFQ